MANSNDVSVSGAIKSILRLVVVSVERSTNVVDNSLSALEHGSEILDRSMETANESNKLWHKDIVAERSQESKEFLASLKSSNK